MNTPSGCTTALLTIALFMGCSESAEQSAPLDKALASKLAAIAERSQLDALYESDRRIRVLIESTSAHMGHYDRDTGDILGLLFDKLAHGSSDALHLAKEELGQMGELAVPELERLLNRHFDDPLGNARVQNCLDVLGRIESVKAHAVLVKCLDHPRDSVRGAALRSLAAGSARPEDFERLKGHIPVERVHMRKDAALGMFVADPTRAALTLMDWIEEGRNRDLWPLLSSQIFTANQALIVDRARALFDREEIEVGLPLAVVALSSGDPRAEAYVESLLSSAAGNKRLPAISSMMEGGYLERVADKALHDPAHMIRVAVLAKLVDAVSASGSGPTGETVGRFREALNDGHENVRRLAMSSLLSWNDPEAVDRAMPMLAGDRMQMQEVILALKPALKLYPKLVERTLQMLLKQEERLAERPLEERLAVLQGIGQLPSAAAAEYLHSLAQAATGEIQGLRAHRWLMIQAANTGVVGRTYLASQLAEESDISKRLDLIWAVSSQRDQTSRSFLMEHILSDVDPYEILFTGERMARHGPASVVAPALKRVSLAMTHSRTRPAFDHMLWRWL